MICPFNPGMKDDISLPDSTARPERRARRLSRQAGFTLLELLIVLALVGVISTLVIPVFGGSLTSFQEKSAANKTAAILRHARDVAVSRQAPQLVLLDREGDRVLFCPLIAMADEQETIDDKWLAANPDVKVYDLPKGLAIRVNKESLLPGAGTLRIVFYPSGNSSGGDFFLTGKKKRYRITVNFLTGIVETG
ncbi:MAG: GspH/FimT family pseudopilin [Thermodesulfobacteriota bacterium]